MVGPNYAVASRTRPIEAVVRVPGSKSIANRALICAALAEGPSTLDGLPDGDDTAAMLDCLAALGVDTITAGRSVTITGTGGVLSPGPITLLTRLAGTTARFVTALAALGAGPFIIDGLEPLRRRPMGPLHDALAALGARITPGGAAGQLPVTVAGPLKSAPLELPGDVSSQFITALMLIAPCLDDGLDVRLTTPLVSRPYVQLTAAVMAQFGHEGVDVMEHAVRVMPGQYRSTELAIEPDASSASYPLAAAAIVGGRVRVEGLIGSSLQGDAAFSALLGTMGCAVTTDSTGTTVERRGPLTGISVDMSAMSDLVPTLAAVALFATTPTVITGVGFIRAKESDRLGDLCAELRALGADAVEQADGLLIRPVESLRGATLDTHHDHRLAMAFGLVGLAVPDVVVQDPEVVSKSWPGYWEMLEALP